jgi:predicted ATPase/DNA-binding winged helix-turn-helix (wHTH) protein/class 3 adenylate cyclase
MEKRGQEDQVVAAYVPAGHHGWVIFEFDEFELDTGRFEVRRRGEPCHVEPQVFDVLRHLVEHRDRVVSKEELLDQVWGDRFVSESALTSRIKAARRAVGDSGREQRVIGTVHGRGYRFVAAVEARDAPGETEVRRDVRYARSAAVNIAYEVTGAGALDIVLVPGFGSHLELDWEDPRSAAFLDRIGRAGRLIRFDARGTGLSDRPSEVPDLESRVDDVRAVMDAAGSDRAVVFAYSDGGPTAALFAATYPARTQALVLYGTYACRVPVDGSDAPGRAVAITANPVPACPGSDAAMVEWSERRARAAASPGATQALVELSARVDVRAVLPTIHVPTLVVHRRDDGHVDIANARALADQIPTARLEDLPGCDHVPWIDADQVLGPIERFVEEVSADGAPVAGARSLATTLFTDIVGSTDLNASMGDARWSALLDRHDQILRDAVAEAPGRWVKSTGDGVLAVFEAPARALRAALTARRRLAELGIRIRAAAHTSEIETRGDDVTGLGVTIAARLLALTEPGEILVTDVVRALVSGSGIDFEARATRVLKGVPARWKTYAVAVPEPEVEAWMSTPDAPASAAASTNLPQPSDPFLGRDDDVARVASAVARSRLVTLAGAGGVGKTRLAIEHARQSPRESWFVDLSRVSDPDEVAAAFLDTLCVSRRTEISDADRLVEALEPRSVLLVVDNCEHVLEATGAVVARLVQETDEVVVLATSRRALGVTGEQVLVVAPLGLPSESASVEEQRAADAVRMLWDRAERAGALVDDLPGIVALCRRLDGIPLALELAAARLRAFSAAQILEQLDAGWSMAVARRDQAPAHHVSLDDAIDWSFRLLEPGERDLLLVLSTFRGPFDLAGTAAVAGGEPMPIADRLAQLVDQSLVQSATGPAGRRFRLLETVRAFAAARLDVDAAVAARDRHAAYFADRVEELGALVPGPDEDRASVELAIELDDVHAAFAHAAERGEVDTAARLASGPRLALSTTSARWAHLALRAVAIPGIEAHPDHVALLASAAWGAVLVGDLPCARALAADGLALVGSPAGHPRLCWIWPQATGGSFAEGADCCLAGASAAAAAGDPAAESFLLGTAAIYRLAAGDEDAAVEVARRALAVARVVGSRTLQARAAGALAYALQDLDAAAARRAAQEVLEVAAPGDFHLNMPHRVLAILAWRDGDYEAAAEHAARAAALIRDQGDRYVQAASMRQLAAIVGSVDAPLGAELLGIADGLVPEVRVIARDEVADARLREELVATLGADDVAALVARGRRDDVRAVSATVDRALRQIRAGRRDAGRGPAPG